MSDEIVREFLVEGNENLDTLDRELIQLERDPHNRATLASVFRTIHTIKGTCGFLGFTKLEAVAHVGENLLSKLRDGELVLNPRLLRRCCRWWTRCGKCCRASRRSETRASATTMN